MALVLSGGVVKAGAWHLGVALALKELGFRQTILTKKEKVLRLLPCPSQLFVEKCSCLRQTFVRFQA